jgi:hypothetical protein
MLMTEFNINIAKAVWQEEAREERAVEFARKLLRRRRPIDEIIEDTGLTREEIEGLHDVE